MQCLLDANILIYLDLEPAKLTPAAQREILDPANDLYLSVASVWEMQLKIARGKLALSRSLQEVIAGQCQTNGIRLLNLELSHIFRLETLPFNHSDPFDRILIAQAQVEGMAIVTSDGAFAQYGVSVIW
jgi:PIN domain nuclease of toxin-antitoxin system